LYSSYAYTALVIIFFGIGPLTVKGPVVGAYIGYLPDISWRWSEWVVLIAVGATILLLGLSAEETFAPRLLQYKAKRFRELTGNDKFKTAMEASHPSRAGVVRKCFRQPFSLGREPIVIAFTFYLTFIYIVFFTFLDGSACIQALHRKSLTSCIVGHTSLDQRIQSTRDYPTSAS
jgi:hypothetical protein